MSIGFLQSKDTNRKIRIMVVLICICGSLIGSKLGSTNVNTGERVLEAQQRHCAYLLGCDLDWNQNFTTVFYRKCCSYLSISIFSIFYIESFEVKIVIYFLRRFVFDTHATMILLKFSYQKVISIFQVLSKLFFYFLSYS